MKFCQSHWEKLRAAIKARGIWDLVAKDGVEALQQAKEELDGKSKNLENFDPLMSAHWAICNNAMATLSKIGSNPLSLLCSDPEHPEWECPICYLNFLSAEHDRTCTDPTCTKKKGQTFDEWIDKAADGAAQVAKSMPQST